MELCATQSWGLRQLEANAKHRVGAGRSGLGGAVRVLQFHDRHGHVANPHHLQRRDAGFKAAWDGFVA